MHTSKPWPIQDACWRNSYRDSALTILLTAEGDNIKALEAEHSAVCSASMSLIAGARKPRLCRYYLYMLYSDEQTVRTDAAQVHVPSRMRAATMPTTMPMMPPVPMPPEPPPPGDGAELPDAEAAEVAGGDAGGAGAGAA